MKVKITRNTIAGGQAVNEGQVVEVSDVDGRLLIGMGKAVAVIEASEIKTADAQVPNIETGDAVKSPRRKK